MLPCLGFVRRDLFAQPTAANVGYGDDAEPAKDRPMPGDFVEKAEKQAVGSQRRNGLDPERGVGDGLGEQPADAETEGGQEDDEKEDVGLFVEVYGH